MKVSLNWVKEYTDVTVSVDELVQKIGAQLGAVEEVIDLGKKYQGIVIAKVVSCQKHSNADKLKVCLIDDGKTVKDVKRNSEGLVEVVCGASNVTDGMLVAWLPPGTTVPATYDKDPLVLEARDIRGVVSNGMLASSRELALGDDHSGILEIDNPGTGTHKDPSVDINDHVAAFKNIEFTHKYEPGDDFAKAFGLDDYIIDIENKMFTHRPDLFGQLGIAREIAGITGKKFTSPGWYVGYFKQPQPISDGPLLEIRNEIPELVPRFMTQVIENITVGPSSVRMQAYLARVGLRPVNNIVDITNFMMVLTGQPLHAYDYDKVKARSAKDKPVVVVRYPLEGEKLKLLGGKIVEPRKEAIVIATNKEAIGLGGVMGGADTEVNEHTRRIILECANFDMYSIRKTAMEHGLFTDAVTRFTKGQSPWQVSSVLRRAISDIICEAGGIPDDTIYDLAGEGLQLPSEVSVSFSFINSRLGLRLQEGEIAELLANVEFENTIENGNLTVGTPFWRTDIEIPEDIVEEVGRLYGYDHLPLELPKRSLRPAQKDKMITLKSSLRGTLSPAGANELLTYSFVHGDLLDKTGQDKNKAFKLANALSPELQYYRLSITPSLLDKVHPNIKAGYGEFALYEINKIHMKGQQDASEPDLPQEDTHVALVFAANDKVAATDYEGAAYYQVRKYFDQLSLDEGCTLVPLVDFDLGDDAWGRQMTAPYEPKRAAVIVKDTGIWGVIGEFRLVVRRALKLPDFTAGFEVAIDVLHHELNSYVPLPRFPKVEQDISLRVSARLKYSELYMLLHAQIEALKPDNTLARLQPLDIFQRPEDKEHKHVTFRLSIAAYDRTLTAEAVNTLLDQVARAAHETFDAERL